MLVDLGARLATQYRIKIGGLDPKKRTAESGRQWQAPQKWDHFKLCTNERGADGNFKVAKELMEAYGEKPRSINVILFSNRIEDIYDDWRAYYAGRKCQCRSMDGREARWNTKLNEVPNYLTTIRQENGFAILECPGDACKFTEGSQCKINSILRCMIKEAPSLGGAAEFRTTSINSALQLRGSLALLDKITGGNIAGIPLELKLEPRHTEKGTVFVAHLTYGADVLSLKQKAIEYSQQAKEYDTALVDVLSASTVAETETEEEIEGVEKEFYSETAEDTPAEGDAASADQPTEEQEAGDSQAEGTIDDLFEANEEAQKEREKEESPPPAKEPQEDLQLFT